MVPALRDRVSDQLRQARRPAAGIGGTRLPPHADILIRVGQDEVLSLLDWQEDRGWPASLGDDVPAAAFDIVNDRRDGRLELFHPDLRHVAPPAYM